MAEADAWPPAPTPVKAKVIAVIGFPFLALGSGNWAVDAAREGASWEAFFWGLAAFMFVVFAATGLTGWQRPRPSRKPPGTGVDDLGNPGLRFRHSLIATCWFYVLFGIPGVFALALAVDLFRRDRPIVQAVIAAAAAAFLGWFCIAMARRGRGRLVLTADGVYHHSALADQFVPWRSVTGVRAMGGTTPLFLVDYVPSSQTRVSRPSYLFIGEPPTLTSITVTAAQMGRFAEPAYKAVCEYLDNPNRRGNLGIS
ncbi:hypothetical protein [Kineosporia sp. NBRC 101731]|uniref:hypothetical protein n=1 Tax=Kineosporia sp. NBRC 101731 TaxID=3032199 RepID=UPI0024A1EE02|nr:hypothetical protein [Kineosporia sp. NBRC 101731]GLY32511.1 hypothetical protein Kisp02_58760 [Kineosporia sp. NBRC 101731]